MMRCIAIDDEPIALKILQNFCDRRGGINLETYSSPRVGMRRIADTRPDIVFLDIEMSGTSGIELARELPEGTCLIFTTAYAQYAVDGFDVNAVDFLHKPYFYARFARAIDKAEEWIKMQAAVVAARSTSAKILLKSGYKNVFVPVDEILYAEAMENYVKVHMSDHTTIISQIALRSIEEMLPADSFVRVHRSFLVSRAAVTSFSRTSVTLSGVSEPIPIGRKYATSALLCFTDNS